MNNVVSVQVQNLTPQLVNAGTIKMTYPENKVLLMAMMARMTIKTVFEDDVGQRQIMGRKRGLQLARSAQIYIFIPAFEQPMIDGGGKIFFR